MMSFIDEVREDRGELARVLKRHKGIRKIVEDLYPDRAHFIYELLQNAEDAGATEATFCLSGESVIFEHDGRPFSEEDIEGITDIGEGTKAGSDDKIGRFGVGFKAVFAYSETPCIWSPTFCFKISDLVLPEEIPSKIDLGQMTRFEFPFNNPKKKARLAFAEIEAGLNELAETTLLFLKNLRVIRWRIGSSTHGEVLRHQHSKKHVEVVKRINGRKVAGSHFILFAKPVVDLDTQRVAIAYEMDYLPKANGFNPQKDLSAQLRIVPANRGTVSVFFPAEKETSGLRFHVHAPFVPELSRASIKDSSANKPLLDQIAKLSASSLHELRRLKLLTTEFLGVLPNSHDQIHERYQQIREEIWEEMKTEPLTPTHSRSHAPAKNLLQGKAVLKALLSKDDLRFLFKTDEELEDLQWAAAANQKSSPSDWFLEDLKIREWDVEELVERLEENVSKRHSWAVPDDDFVAWLREKPAEWFQHLYAALRMDLSSRPGYGRRTALERLKYLKIIRLGTGELEIPGNCFFPDEDALHDNVLPRVDPGVYSSGKSKTQQQEARSLLEELGVREVGEREQVEAILKTRYTEEADIPEPKVHLRDIKRFVRLVETEPATAGVFQDFYIFEQKDRHWNKPGAVFLDKPYMDTGLSAFYRALGSEADRCALSSKYTQAKVSVDRLRRFAEAIGVQSQLNIEWQTTYHHPCRKDLQQDALRYHVRHTNTGLDNDWIIQNLEIVLADASERISRLIWQTMRGADEKVLTAEYRPNQQYKPQEAPSSLVLLLQKHAWVPQRGGGFVRPREASPSRLPKGFPFDPGEEWLAAIEFGLEEHERSKEHKQKAEDAKRLGFEDAETLDRAKTFAALPQSEQKRILAQLMKKEEADLPDQNPSDRRLQGVAKRASQAPLRESETRSRTVAIGEDDVRKEAESYLRQQYTDADGEMVCQVCKEALPFRLDNGSYYFEKVTFLDDLKRWHRENFLALCPTHGAMFRHANASRDQLREAFISMEGQRLEVILAQNEESIYFTKAHLADLRTVIEVDQSTEVEEPASASAV